MEIEKVIKEKSEICKTTALGFTMLFVVFFLAGCGERNSAEARLLGTAMVNHLSEQGICQTTRECSDKFNWTGEHENGVHWNIYDAKDRKAVAILIDFVVEHGIKITGGVPISITVYPKLRKEYGNYLIKPKHIIQIILTA